MSASPLSRAISNSSVTRTRPLISGINVTPLVDIMLVLLIIFMVTASHIDRHAIAVELPKAATGEPKQSQIVTITIGTDGALRLNGRRSSLEDIRAFVKSAKKGDLLEGLIAADRAVPHGRVVELIDLLRGAGIERFAIEVRKSTAAE